MKLVLVDSEKSIDANWKNSLRYLALKYSITPTTCAPRRLDLRDRNARDGGQLATVAECERKDRRPALKAAA